MRIQAHKKKKVELFGKQGDGRPKQLYNGLSEK